MTKKFRLLLVSAFFSVSLFSQSTGFIGLNDLDFIAQIVTNASNAKTSCVLQYLENKDYVTIDESLTFAPLNAQNSNLVVQFNSKEVDFILAKKDLSVSWYSYNQILDDLIDLTGIPNVYFSDIVNDFIAKDPSDNSFTIVKRGYDFIDVFNEIERETYHYKRSNLVKLKNPEFYYNQNGSVRGVTLNLLYYLGETSQNIGLTLNIFSNESTGGYFVNFTAPFTQKNVGSSVNCSYGSRVASYNKRPVLNQNPLDFADGYNLNSYDLESYLNVFYYDLYVNAPGYFGDDIPTVAFKVMQKHKSRIYFKEIPANQRNEASNILALAWGMFDDCRVQIQVNPNEWHKADNVRRLWIIYHELCHDVFNLEHECGIALMNPTIPAYIDETMFLGARDELIDYIYANDLFTNACSEEFQTLDQLLNGQ